MQHGRKFAETNLAQLMLALGAAWCRVFKRLVGAGEDLPNFPVSIIGTLCRAMTC